VTHSVVNPVLISDTLGSKQKISLMRSVPDCSYLSFDYVGARESRIMNNEEEDEFEVIMRYIFHVRLLLGSEKR